MLTHVMFHILCRNRLRPVVGNTSLDIKCCCIFDLGKRSFALYFSHTM